MPIKRSAKSVISGSTIWAYSRTLIQTANIPKVFELTQKKMHLCFFYFFLWWTVMEDKGERDGEFSLSIIWRNEMKKPYEIVL